MPNLRWPLINSRLGAQIVAPNFLPYFLCSENHVDLLQQALDDAPFSDIHQFRKRLIEVSTDSKQLDRLIEVMIDPQNLGKDVTEVLSIKSII